MRQDKEKNIKQNKKSKKDKDSSKNKKQTRSIKSFFIKFGIFILILALIIGIAFLIFKAYTFQSLAKDMFNNVPSTILDSNKNTIAQIGIERNRKQVDFSDIPEQLVNAYVSIEDQRFYKHYGIDIRRTGAAILSYITHAGSSSFGGSTITQQLVKNITGDDSNSVFRKIKEWFYAWTLEIRFSKEEILEAYLNIIYTGPNIYGVQEAAHYYFNKDVNQLSLAECAFLAGINNAPNSYNPFSDTDRTEKITNRTKTVLDKMLELEYISEDEHSAAITEVSNGLNFNKGELTNNSSIYSYHTDALINEVISDLSAKKHISQDFATNYLYMSGANIYSTENTDIQKVLENESKKNKYILKSSNEIDTSQAAMVVIDHSTGYVVACTGGLGDKTTSRSFNRVTQMTRQTGSAMKPLAVLLPAIDKKIVTNVTVFADEPTTFIDYNGEQYSPVNYDGYKGSITLRQAVESSQNIPFVKIMEQLTPQVAIKYLKKMGITTLNDKDVNLALSLGGLDKGISPLEFAGGYATIANDGVYIEPTFYTKVTSNSGETVLNSKQKKRRVVSKDVAYILKQLLTEPVTGTYGTATYCSISGMDVAAKTGTTNENYDRWLCGFTPYYTAVCWYGFDMNESIDFNGRNPAGLIWSSVMKEIHSGLPNARFEMPSGVITATICRDSGKVANSSCPNTFTEYFLRGTVPDVCTQHSGSSLTTNKTTTTPSNSSSTNATVQNSSQSSSDNSDFTYENNTSEKGTQNSSVQNNHQNTTTNSAVQNSTNDTTTNTNTNMINTNQNMSTTNNSSSQSSTNTNTSPSNSVSNSSNDSGETEF